MELKVVKFLLEYLEEIMEDKIGRKRLTDIEVSMFGLIRDGFIDSTIQQLTDLDVIGLSEVNTFLADVILNEPFSIIIKQLRTMIIDNNLSDIDIFTFLLIQHLTKRKLILQDCEDYKTGKSLPWDYYPTREEP